MNLDKFKTRLFFLLWTLAVWGEPLFYVVMTCLMLVHR